MFGMPAVLSEFDAAALTTNDTAKVVITNNSGYAWSEGLVALKPIIGDVEVDIDDLMPAFAERIDEGLSAAA